MPQTLQKIIESMDPMIYKRIATASETGKWPDGVSLTDEQKNHCLQLVLLWQARYHQEDEQQCINSREKLIMKSKKDILKTILF